MRFSWTISKYIFKDLFKIFMITNGALAGIMSFGGLLRPLTQQGLDAGQIGAVLGWFTPAMWAYSLPIAALFAATVVYGRISADNELTACRASGISHMSIALPALALGLFVALFSLLMLSFLVPKSTLKVEKVVYSNIAKLIANRIDRTHQIKFGAATVFAQEAHLPALSQADVEKGEQQVVLIGPTIVTYDHPKKEEDWHYKVPMEFWTASRATVFISRPKDSKGDDELELTIQLENGTKFPRDFKGGLHAAVGNTHFGPIQVSSPIKENVKFMDLWQLKDLYGHQEKSTRISRLQETFIDRYQKEQFGNYARDVLNDPARRNELTLFPVGGNERYILERGPKPAMVVDHAGDRDLIVGALQSELSKTGEVLRLRTPGAPEPTRNVKLWHLVNNNVETMIEAADARVRARPRREQGVIDISVELHDAVLPTPEGPVKRAMVPQTFAVTLPEAIRKLEQMPLSWFVTPQARPYGHEVYIQLKRELIILSNDIWSEMNSRVSFALSCLILVMVGAALGMMFRSGNFLTAFAISFVPALVSITLIIAGQRVCGNVGWKLEDPNFRNPLPLGIALIWSGNVANFIIATVLLGRLWRT